MTTQTEAKTFTLVSLLSWVSTVAVLLALIVNRPPWAMNCSLRIALLATIAFPLYYFRWIAEYCPQLLREIVGEQFLFLFLIVFLIGWRLVVPERY
jgi:hypothetical protein